MRVSTHKKKAFCKGFLIPTHTHTLYMTRYTFQFLKKYMCIYTYAHVCMCVEYIKEEVQPRGRNTNLQRERKKNGIKKYMFYCSIFFPPSLRDDPKPTELPGAGRCCPLPSKPIYTHTHTHTHTLLLPTPCPNIQRWGSLLHTQQ